MHNGDTAMEKFGFKKTLAAKKIFEGVFGTYLGSGEKMNAMHWIFEDGVALPAHSHEAEQFGYIIRGGFKVTIDGETKLLEAGDFYFVPSNAQHSFVSVGKTEAIDVFSPIRVFDF